MRRLLRLFLLLPWLASVPQPVHAQVQEDELKAAVIYNFMQFTQWPDKAGAGTPLNLCMSPENALYGALLRVAARSAGREVAVVPIINAGIGDCDAIFMSYEDKRKAGHFQRLLAGPVLSVTDDATVLPGEMMIVMSVERSRIVFSVNNARAVASGLSISSRLLRLARSVQ
jgi:hypothetical protein